MDTEDIRKETEGSELPEAHETSSPLEPVTDDDLTEEPAAEAYETSSPLEPDPEDDLPEEAPSPVPETSDTVPEKTQPEIVSPDVSEKEAPEQQVPAEPVKEKKKNRKGLILALIALLLLLGAGCAWFFLLGPGAKRYTVTFDAAGGTDAEAVSVLAGKEVPLPEVSREGYEFKGWTLNGIAIKEPFVPMSDVTLTADWEGELHSILFECVGAVPDKYESHFRTGDPIQFPSDPVKTGYAFSGWEGASGTAYNAGDPMPAEDLVLHAVWTEKSFRVTFDTDGGSSITPLILMDGVPLPDVKPTKENYTFDHWEDKNGKTVKAGDKLPCEDITLYAKWTRKTFKVSFDSKGGSSVPSITVNAGDTLKLPANPTRSGYEFVTWQDKNSTPIYDGALLTPVDITLYAVWKETKVDVTGLEVTPSAVTLGIGKTQKLSVTVKPSDATDKTVSYSSDNTSVATVDSSGVITGKGKGSCTITVSSSNGIECHIPVEVKNYVTGINLYTTVQYLSPASGPAVVTCDVIPSDADIKAVQWLVTGNVDESGERLARKEEKGNQITFYIGTEGERLGGSFTVQAVARDGSVTKSEQLTIIVERSLALTVSNDGGGLRNFSDSDGKLQLFVYDNKGTTTVKSNCNVEWTYDTSNGVISDVSTDSSNISFVVHNVGTGSHYTGTQIKAKTYGGQEYIIVINPVT